LHNNIFLGLLINRLLHLSAIVGDTIIIPVNGGKQAGMFIYRIRRDSFYLLTRLSDTRMKDISLYVGIGAGICTAISLLPQLIRIIKKKKADDISFFMLIILLIGLSGWIWYGMLRKDYPIIITNAFSFIVNVLIIIFSVLYKRK